MRSSPCWQSLKLCCCSSAAGTGQTLWVAMDTTVYIDFDINENLSITDSSFIDCTKIAFISITVVITAVQCNEF